MATATRNMIVGIITATSDFPMIGGSSPNSSCVLKSEKEFVVRVRVETIEDNDEESVFVVVVGIGVVDSEKDIDLVFQNFYLCNKIGTHFYLIIVKKNWKVITMY